MGSLYEIFSDAMAFGETIGITVLAITIALIG
jgi:hypothetical protein